MEFWIWLIIVVIMAIAKGFEKLAEASRQPPSEQAPPVPPVSQPERKRPPRARQPKPHRAPPPVRPKAPPPVVSPPVEAVASLPGFPQPPQPAGLTSTPQVAAMPPSRRSERARLWASVLRDRQTLGSLVVAREILGPPRSLREYEPSGW